MPHPQAPPRARSPQAGPEDRGQLPVEASSASRKCCSLQGRHVGWSNSPGIAGIPGLLFFLENLFICLVDGIVNEPLLAFQKELSTSGGEHSQRGPGTHRREAGRAPDLATGRGSLGKGQSPTPTASLTVLPAGAPRRATRVNHCSPRPRVCTWPRRAQGPWRMTQ